jgi:hypothetical protein
MSTFHPFFGAHAQTGLNYLGRVANDHTQMKLVGLDFVAKWKKASTLDFLLQSEVWMRTLKARHSESERTLGLYLFPQAALTSELYFGVLWDYYRNLSLQDIAGRSIDNSEQHFVPTLTYKASEFATLRLAYNYGMEKRESVPTQVDSSVEVQATYILGAHPAHEF